MWLLDGDSTVWIRDKLTVGRKGLMFLIRDCDILLKQDKSVSRLHATLCLDQESLLVSDNNSKVGVFVNSKKIDQSTILSNGDALRIANTPFTVRCIDLVIYTGLLPTPQRNSVQKECTRLAIKTQKSWTDCTHAIVDKIEKNALNLHLLHSVKPVTLDWFNELCNQPILEFQWPAEQSFIPEADFDLVNYLKTDKSRLLSGKTLKFTAASLKKYNDLIQLMGGAATSQAKADAIAIGPKQPVTEPMLLDAIASLDFSVFNDSEESTSSELNPLDADLSDASTVDLVETEPIKVCKATEEVIESSQFKSQLKTFRSVDFFDELIDLDIAPATNASPTTDEQQLSQDLVPYDDDPVDDEPKVQVAMTEKESKMKIEFANLKREPAKNIKVKSVNFKRFKKSTATITEVPRIKMSDMQVSKSQKRNVEEWL